MKKILKRVTPGLVRRVLFGRTGRADDGTTRAEIPCTSDLNRLRSR